MGRSSQKIEKSLGTRTNVPRISEPKETFFAPYEETAKFVPGFKETMDDLPMGVSVVATSDRRRIYANTLFLRFFRGTSLKTMEDIVGLRTEDYHVHNPLQLAKVDQNMVRLEKTLLSRRGPGYDLCDQAVILPEGAGFIFYNAYLRSVGRGKKRMGLVWYFQETTWLQNPNRVLEAYLTAYRERGREREGVAAFLKYFDLQELFRRQVQTKNYIRVLLGKLYRDKAKSTLEHTYRAHTTIVSYAARINKTLREADITIRDIRQHFEDKLQATQKIKDMPALEDLWNDEAL